MSALILRYLGIPGMAILAMLFFYEGVPFLGSTFVAEIFPSGLLQGRVRSHAQTQVKLATSNMVSKYEVLSLEAELRREKELRKIAESESEDLAKARLAAEIRLRQIEATTKGLPLPTEDELKWFDLHFPR